MSLLATAHGLREVIIHRPNRKQRDVSEERGRLDSIREKEGMIRIRGEDVKGEDVKHYDGDGKLVASLFWRSCLWCCSIGQHWSVCCDRAGRHLWRSRRF
jgi:hypothetical protein